MAINAIQAAIRSMTGTERQFNGDLHAYWDQLGIPPGQFAERMVAWKSLPQNAAWIAATEDADAPEVVAGLWRNGEQGMRFEASDLATMFQDAAGTLPVYAPGGGQVDPPVGRMLDKSGRGNHAFQTTTTSRPTLPARHNLLTATEPLATQSVAVVATAYTLTTAGPGSVTLSGAASGTYTAGSRIVTCTAGTLALTVSGSVTQADLRPANGGVGLPPYQRVVDASTYDTIGFPLYLKFDGVDDWLQTASVDFSGTDKVTLAAALRKLTDAVVGMLAELGPDVGATAGTFGLYARNSGAAEGIMWRSRGASLASAAPPGLRAPSSLVAVGSSDLSTGRHELRVNGASAALSSTTQGGGTYGGYPLYIGRRGGTSLPFDGRLYSLLIRGAATPDATIAKIERYLSQKAKVF